MLEGQSAQISNTDRHVISKDAQSDDGQAKKSAKDAAADTEVTQSQAANVEREHSQTQALSAASVQTVPASLGHQVTNISSTFTTTTSSAPIAPAQVTSADDDDDEEPLPIVYDQGGESSGDEVSDGILLLQSEPQNDEVSLTEIRREAVSIANTIVEKAKEELNKQQQQQQQAQASSQIEQKVQRVQSMSLEISDEELVEKGDTSPMDRETLQYSMQHSSSVVHEPTTSSDQQIPTSPSQPSDKIEQQILSPTITTKQQSNLIEVPKEDANLVMISSSESSQQISETSSTRTNTTNSSRPTSSEYDLTIIPEVTPSTTSTTYQTAATTTGNQSYVTVPTSQETSYFTAQSNLSSGKTSSQSMNDSSANVGELSSEASETVIGDNDNATSCHSDDEVAGGESTEMNEFEEHYQRTSQLNTDSVEPFNCDIPLSLLSTTSTSAGGAGDQDNWELVPNEMSASGYLYTLPSSAVSADQSTNGNKMSESFVLLDDSGPQSQNMGGESDQSVEDFAYLTYGRDQNLYTHVEVDEEGSEDNFELKKSSLVQSSPLSLASKHEAESSSTSSSLKEFERLESDLIKDRADSGGAGDFSVDSRHLESAKLEKTTVTSYSESLFDTSLADAEDNNESLNSEVSQDTITCIKNDPLDQFITSSKVTTASVETITKLKTFSKSLDTEHQTVPAQQKKDTSGMAEMFDPLFEEPKRVPSSLLDDDETSFQFTQSKDISELQSKSSKVVVTKMSSLSDSYDQQSSTSDVDPRSGPMLASYHSEASMKDSFFALGSEPMSEAMLVSSDSTANPVLECDFPDSLDSSMIASTGDLQCDQVLDQQHPTSHPNGNVNSGTIVDSIISSTN